MKIYINREPVKGPYGGGNRTVTALTNALKIEGHEVVFGLHHSDIDIIFCFDPRLNHLGEWFVHCLEYKKNINNNVKIIQRVGDLGTHGKSGLYELVEQAMKFSDFKIFPSKWAREKSGFSGKNYKIIPNAPMDVFRSFKRDNKVGTKIELVTHHWSTNPKKGFEIYKYLDENIVCAEIGFTYIGRLPKEFKFKNSTHIPASGDDEYVAKQLSNADIYFTASEEEAGANHVLEGMAAGLPVVFYTAGGSINEYCQDYGVSFSSPSDILRKIGKVVSDYSEYKKKVLEYDNTIENVIKEYIEIISNAK